METVGIGAVYLMEGKWRESSKFRKGGNIGERNAQRKAWKRGRGMSVCYICKGRYYHNFGMRLYSAYSCIYFFFYSQKHTCGYTVQIS